MKRILSLLLFCLTMFSLQAQSIKDDADSAYADKHYAQAAEQYAVLADSLPSADVYYNLGNAEYRLKHYAEAVLAYQRALHLDPGHEDAQYNLAIVRSRLADRFSKPSEMFFISWLKTWITSHGVTHWTALSFLWLILIFVGVGIYQLTRPMWLRKVGFFFAIFSGVCFALLTAFAIVQRYAFSHNDDAVITAEEVQLYLSPTPSSKKLQVLHEGTTVTIIGTQDKTWLHVALPDDTEAWMKAEGYERVKSERDKE